MPFHFTVSENGSLVYVPPSSSHSATGERSIVWVNRRGEATPVGVPKGAYGDPRLSPDDMDVSLLRVEGAVRKTEPFLEGPANEWTPKLSPDGRYLAYLSDESGRAEVIVRPYPARDPKIPISTDGGTEPLWSRTAAGSSIDRAIG